MLQCYSYYFTITREIYIIQCCGCWNTSNVYSLHICTFEALIIHLLIFLWNIIPTTPSISCYEQNCSNGFTHSAIPVENKQMAGDNGTLIKIDNTLHLYFAMVAMVLPRVKLHIFYSDHIPNGCAKTGNSNGYIYNSCLVVCNPCVIYSYPSPGLSCVKGKLHVAVPNCFWGMLS